MDIRQITPVILSGGSGTRLWPLSRAAKPKQLLALLGDESMLQLTARRVADPDKFAAPIVIANTAHADIVEAQLALTGVTPARLTLEPFGRNTAAAIALGALAVKPDQLLLVLPSDHVIQDEGAFASAVEDAIPLAEDGWLVTFGIRPDRPETGYGYIKRGAQLGTGVFRADRFVEKPGLSAAQAYIDDDIWDWNAGIFLFRADIVLGAFLRHAPDILETSRVAHDGARLDGNRVYLEPADFARIRSQSFDDAIMERADRVAVAPVEMGWSDMGSWDALYAMGAKDPHGNHLSGDVSAIDSRNTLIKSDGPLVITIGVENLIVIASGDAVVVLPRGDSQRIKDVIKLLEARKRSLPL